MVGDASFRSETERRLSTGWDASQALPFVLNMSVAGLSTASTGHSTLVARSSTMRLWPTPRSEQWTQDESFCCRSGLNFQLRAEVRVSNLTCRKRCLAFI